VARQRKHLTATPC